MSAFLTELEDKGRNITGLAVRYGTPQGVYYDDFGQVAALHESLHLLTKKNDIDLAEQLTGNKFANGSAAGDAITAALKNNGCAK
jgi:hypothetical protein